MKTIFVTLIHGNEDAPLAVIDKYFRRQLKYLIANPVAHQKNTRFLETDLNRSFPGNSDGSKEEKIAAKLLVTLKNYDQVVDLHTATCNTPPFAILTKVSPRHLKLASNLGVEKLVFMQKSIASGRSLIDHVSLGISIECGLNQLVSTRRIIKKIINSFFNHHRRRLKPKYYSVFEILLKTNPDEILFDEIKPFKLVKKGDRLSQIGQETKHAPFDFYPILPRETSYPQILCLAAKRIYKPNSLNVKI